MFLIRREKNLHRRVEKRVLNAAGTRTLRERYVYVGYTCVQILNGDGGNAVVKEFVWDPTEPVATRPLMFGYIGKGLYFFYTVDGNKNVSDVFFFALGNGIGAHYEYAPFGAITRTSSATHIGNVDIIADNPFRFSSEFYDSELDLVYYNYRHYSPALGRFLSRDPIEEQGGLNLYAFVGNAPVSEFDHLGGEATDGIRFREKSIVEEIYEKYSIVRTLCDITTINYRTVSSYIKQGGAPVSSLFIEIEQVVKFEESQACGSVGVQVTEKTETNFLTGLKTEGLSPFETTNIRLTYRKEFENGGYINVGVYGSVLSSEAERYEGIVGGFISGGFTF